MSEDKDLGSYSHMHERERVNSDGE